MTLQERLIAMMGNLKPAIDPSTSLSIAVPAPSFSDKSLADRVLAGKVLDPGTSLAFPLASPLGFEPATILFDYTTVSVGDKVAVYNAPFVRWSTGAPLASGSIVIDVVFPRGLVNWGASYMVVYTVVNGVPV